MCVRDLRRVCRAKFRNFPAITARLRQIFSFAKNIPPRQRVARLNADGSLDTTFFPDALAATNRINALAVQTDGKVLIGVALSTVKRLNTDGTLDNTFTTTMTPQVGVIEIKFQADDKILIGGGWSTNFRITDW